MLPLALALFGLAAQDPAPEHPLNSWVKRTPLEKTPTSPRLGYEGDCVWDPGHRVILRYGGHNQGGGGEQHSDLWTCEPFSGTWTLKEPNLSPPGVCCAQQNLFDPVQGRYLRFPAFSGSHGWQWQREIYMNQSSVWSYDLDANLWRNLRPYPTVPLAPLRCASWDSEYEVAVVFGGEGSSAGTLVYDPYANTWTGTKPARQPAFRSGGNMTYDAARRVHILFGSQFGDEPSTWSYDLRLNEWSDLKPATSPPTKENDAVLKYDAVARVVVAIVKKSEGKDEEAKHELQTWTYDAAANEWTRRNPGREPDRTGNRCRVLMAAPELNLIFLENCPGKPREQQIWSWRTSQGKPAPAPVALKVKTETDAATLTWAPQDQPVTVLRGSGERAWEVEFEEVAKVPAGEGRWRDTGLRPGTLYHYKLSVPSLRARTQPRPPDNVVVSAAAGGQAEVSWTRSPEEDAVGYVVESAEVDVATDDQLLRLKARTPPLEKPAVGMITAVGPFVRSPRVKELSMKVSPAAVGGSPLYKKVLGKDDYDPKGAAYPLKVHAYRVRAVNSLGVESGPSAAVLSIPSSPQNLFAKEEGTTCLLKWQANPESGIKGYRVYRMDGRYDKEPVTRLTPDPIPGLTFSDPDAGKKSRRYYVVAVDSLGQEGSPSSPVWFDREWKSFYLPFIGPWHQ
ncbi:MAG TPA: hypothetical protein VE981_22570 [Planctomycetota bacterium]|nr:hypothetical protein [Planctomycetota bacterium]